MRFPRFTFLLLTWFSGE